MLLRPLDDCGGAQRQVPCRNAQGHVDVVDGFFGVLRQESGRELVVADRDAQRDAPRCDSDGGGSACGAEIPCREPLAQAVFPLLGVLASPLLDECCVEVVWPVRLRSQSASSVKDAVDVLRPEVVAETFEWNEQSCAPLLDGDVVGASLLFCRLPDG
eukprot:9503510-Pyramimonas_sp.AAC.1